MKLLVSGLSVLLVAVLICHSGISYRLKGFTPAKRLQTRKDSSNTALRASTKQLILDYFDQKDLKNNIYACPESLEPLEFTQRLYGFITEKFLLERKFGTKYPIKPSSCIDFISHEELPFIGENGKLGQIAFQNPFMSYIYDRQNFKNFGFPGIEKEFNEAKDFFINNNAKSIILDLSCGSGFMTRRFINSTNNFERVIAADLSPTMLLDTRRNCKAEKIPVPELVRCDSAKLPFQSNSIDAIHAGAAMHCWPRIGKSLSEIYRVLKPGGVYFATTIKQQQAGNSLKRAANQQGFSFFESEEEVQKLLKDAGFDGEGGSQEVRIEGSRCFVIKAKKTKESEIITIPVN